MGMAVKSERMNSSHTPLIVGMGATGLSCARHYQRQRRAFTIVDSRVEPPGLEQLRVQCPRAEIITGEIPLERLLSATQLLVSPGVALQQPAVAEAIARGVPVIGDIDLFMAEAKAPVVGITGSNGKSTVTELLGAMSRAAGKRVGVGGNLGPPALDLLEKDAELYVLELSSFQLERCGNLQLALACNLNLSADHIDRHGDMQTYVAAKQRVYAGCESLVYNRDDNLTRPEGEYEVSQISFGLDEPTSGNYGLREVEGTFWLCHGSRALIKASELSMVGHHNVANALAALSMGELLGLDGSDMLSALVVFKGLPHRSQKIATLDGVEFINDSKATNAGATQAALRGLAGSGASVLIAGGQAKGADFTELAEDIVACCKSVVLIGEDAALLERLLAGRLPLVRATTMQAAVNAAAEMAAPGDRVVLSPACASFDMFSGFEDRGRCFAQAVVALEEGGAANG